MRISQPLKIAAVAVSLAWLAGCSSTSTLSEQDQAGMQGGRDGQAQGADAYASGTGTGVSGTGMSTPVDVANLRSVFYFDFDQSSIRSDSVADLEAHAQYLASHPAASVRLEGHADERGTREYNMALGERRGNAVERFLAINGVSSQQIEVVSYGEEKPAVLGSGDMSWSQNRRVELKYQSR